MPVWQFLQNASQHRRPMWLLVALLVAPQCANCWFRAVQKWTKSRGPALVIAGQSPMVQANEACSQWSRACRGLCYRPSGAPEPQRPATPGNATESPSSMRQGAHRAACCRSPLWQTARLASCTAGTWGSTRLPAATAATGAPPWAAAHHGAAVCLNMGLTCVQGLMSMLRSTCML
jgi:hypothetical protein